MKLPGQESVSLICKADEGLSLEMNTSILDGGLRLINFRSLYADRCIDFVAILRAASSVRRAVFSASASSARVTISNLKHFPFFRVTISG